MFGYACNNFDNSSVFLYILFKVPAGKKTITSSGDQDVTIHLAINTLWKSAIKTCTSTAEVQNVICGLQV